MNTHFLPLLEWWGRQIARYGLWTIGKSRVIIENRPPGTRFIAVDWHSHNLVAIAVVRAHLGWNAFTFTPRGVVGTAARGWHLGSGLNSVPLPEDGTGNVVTAMKHMLKALNSGGTPIISVDGPHGPAWKTRPGALWLARLSGAPIVPVGISAAPAVHFPRWDRHLIPMPGSRTAVIFGPPITITRTQAVDQPLLDSLTQTLHDLTAEAENRVRRAG